MGRERARAEIFLRHLQPLQGPLEAYCRRSLADRNAIQDVLQSAVANALCDFHLYVEGTNFRAWIFRYVHLEILSSNRRYQRDIHEPLSEEVVAQDAGAMSLEQPLLEALLDDPDCVLENCDEEVALAIEHLPPLERSVLLLSSVGEFRYREIAEILEVPIGTVMSNLARARVRLRQQLLQYGMKHGLLKPLTPYPSPPRGEGKG